MKGINRIGRFFLGAALAAMMVVGCNGPANKITIGDAKVKITFEADSGFKAADFKKAFPVTEVKKGTAWTTLKAGYETSAKKVLNTNKDFDKWQYKKGASYMDIPAGFKFEADTVLKAVSKNKTAPTPPPSTKVKVTFTPDAGFDAIPEMEVGKGSTWADNKTALQDAAKAKVKSTHNFKELQKSDGSALTDDFKFDSDTTLKAVSETKPADTKVKLTLQKGDGVKAIKNAAGSEELAEIEVEKTDKWSDIVAKIKVEYDDANYSKVKWHKNAPGGTEVQDTDMFAAPETLVAVAELKTEKVKITFAKDDATISSITKTGSMDELTVLIVDKTTTLTNLKGMIEVKKDSNKVMDYEIHENTMSGNKVTDENYLAAKGGQSITFFITKPAGGSAPSTVTITLVKPDAGFKSDIEALTNVATTAQWSTLKAQADTNVKAQLNEAEDYKEEYYTIEYHKESASGAVVGNSETFAANTSLYVVLKIKDTHKRINLKMEEASISSIEKKSAAGTAITTFVVERNKNFGEIKALLEFKKDSSSLEADKIKASKGQTKNESAVLQDSEALNEEKVDLFFWAQA